MRRKGYGDYKGVPYASHFRRPYCVFAWKYSVMGSSFLNQDETFRPVDHPVRSTEVASRFFLDVASTPPNEVGNGASLHFIH